MSQNKEPKKLIDLNEELTSTSADPGPQELLLSRGKGRRVSATTCLQMVKRQEELEAYNIKRRG